MKTNNFLSSVLTVIKRIGHFLAPYWRQFRVLFGRYWRRFQLTRWLIILFLSFFW